MTGTVYAAKINRYLKIGWTRRDPTQRLRELRPQRAGIRIPMDLSSSQPAVLVWSTPGSRSDERALRRLLSPWRVVGEWFRCDDDALAVVRKFHASTGSASLITVGGALLIALELLLLVSLAGVGAR